MIQVVLAAGSPAWLNGALPAAAAVLAVIITSVFTSRSLRQSAEIARQTQRQAAEIAEATRIASGRTEAWKRFEWAVEVATDDKAPKPRIAAAWVALDTIASSSLPNDQDVLMMEATVKAIRDAQAAKRGR